MRQFIRILCFCVFLAFSVGCVGQNVYQKKLDEAANLNTDLADARNRNLDLARENERLRGEISTQLEKIGKLEAGNSELRGLIAMKDESPARKIVAQGREIERLRDDLANLQRGREEKARTVSILYESLLERMKDDVAHGRVSITELRGKVSVTVREDVLFSGKTSEFSHEGENIIRKIASFLKGTSDREARIQTSIDMGVRGDRASLQCIPPDSAIVRAVALAGQLGRSGVDPGILSVSASGGFPAGGASLTSSIGGPSRSLEIVILEKE